MNRNIFGPMYNPAAVAITGGTISGVTISDSTINQKFTTSTNPASSVATTTAIVDAYNGVVITTNVNNTQTIANPTTAANIKIFTVINNDTSSSNQTIKANGVDFVLTPGEAQSFIWDGSAWGPTDMGITSLPVPVTQGGTGLATITDHGIMVGSGVGAVTPLGVATDGQIPIGSAGADPVLAAITPGDGIDVTNAAGSITVSADLKANGGLVIEATELAVDLGASGITGTLAVGDGGTGASTLTDHGVLLGSGTDPITALGAMTNGQLVIGSTGNDPVVASITDGEGIDTTAGAGTLTIACEDASESNKGVTVYAGNAKALAGTDTASAMTPADLKYVLDRRIPQYYGVSWNESADTYVRTGSTSGKTCGVTLDDAFLPVHRRMRGCVVADDGTVNYYLCATDWAYKEGPAYATGTITSDGTIPSDGDTVTIGNKTYTFKSALTPTEGEVLIAGSAAAAMTNLMRAITYTGTPNTDYKCAAHHTQVNASYDSLVVTVVSLLGGTVGNGYALSTTDANIAVSAAFMAGGAVNAASDLTGADGQVMVEIPKFWYRYGYSGTTHTWEISPVPLTGFKVHEAFLSDTTEKDYLYVGAYEASLYDTSASLYSGQCYQTSVSAVFATSDDSITIATRTGWTNALKVGQKLVITGTTNNNATVTVKTIESATKITVDENLTDETAATTVIQAETDVTDTTGDVLASVSGVCPITGGSANGTRAHFRTWAENRGGGKAANDEASFQWSQEFGDALAALQLLYLTEYASFYSQSVLGYGIAAVTDWAAYNDYNPIAKTGNGNAVGNASGNTATAAITTGAGAQSVYLKYRGIENLYGHIAKFIDGFKVNNNIPYLCNNFANFSDAENTTNYTNPTDVNGAAITMHNANGYQGTLELTGRGFFPASLTGGSASAKITDYYYQASGWRVVISGGGASDAAYAGAFYLNASNGLAYVYWALGGRLVGRK